MQRLDTGQPIIVTGAAGFIGFHLTRALLAEGRRVVGVDNLNDYYPVDLKRARLAQLANSPQFRFQELDLAESEAVNQLVAEVQPEVICHLAAQAGVRYSLAHPHCYLASNVNGTLNMLEACRWHQVERLVYASSSSVYGGNTKVPFAEDDRVDDPISLYAATKRSGELMARTYTHLFGLQTIGLRFFTVYGRWGRPDMAMWIFTERILRGQPIAVFNHGQMQRDFTHVSDIVAGVRASLFADGLGPCEVINLGNHRCEELGRLIDVIEAACERPATRDYKDLQPGDVLATWADVSKAQRVLGFEPKVTIDEGAADFVAWYRSEPALAAAVATWRAAGGSG